jgi:class 3 adenylate cyclase/tetratricopeptide (TPR) repeat protein
VTETQPTTAPLAPYLPRLVLEWARDHPDTRFRELDGSLVSVDISGFTSLSERLAGKGRIGAEELILLISGVFEGLIGVAHGYGGDVLKFRGDALLLLFPGEGHEQRACTAANGMQWFIETAGSTMSSVGPVELRMSTGVYSGPCQFFLVDASHKELVVVGPAATRTFELEDASEAGEILVSQRTAEALEPGWLDGEREGARLLVRREPEPVETHAAVIETTSEEAGLDQYVPEPLRAHLAVASGEAEHRQVTVAFLKFADTDGIVEHEGPEALATKLQSLAEVVGETCSTYGVTWLESDIDRGAGKFYFTAGAPSSTGSDEEAMLRTLRAVIDAGEGPPLRAGVNRGPVFAGDIGASARRTYAVMGDAVNLAARLCGRAETGQILSTGDVLDRSAARFETERQPFLVKGKERAINAYRVGELSGVREEEAARALPLVGRETELAALQEAVNASRMMQSRIVELVGEPGIGKSRLVDELKTLSIGFNQLVAACDRYSQSDPFFAWRGVLRRLAGMTPEQSREEAGAQLAPWISTVLPDLAPWLPLLAIPFDAEVPSTPESESIDESFRFDRLQDTVEQFLQRVLMMPTLLIFEDAHWMDDASRFLIGRLTAQPSPRPWLVCVTSRPEGASLIGDASPGTRLLLEPLSGEAAAALALSAADETALSEEALSTLAERSGGNPLFVRELVAASREGSVEALPETVETLMTTRIDTLDPEDRMLLRYASVVGPRFELDLLGEILADELPDAGDLSRWERLAEFVSWEGPEMLAFRHDLVRATAYEGLSFRRRRVIHGRVGEALERRAGERVDEAAALLSLHFLAAEQYDKAWRFAVAAADRARANYANVVAGELYQRALDAARHLELPHDEVARAAEALGDVAERFGDFQQAETAYGEARALVPNDGEAQGRLLVKEGVLRERSGEYEEALAWYDDALRKLTGFDLKSDVQAKLCAQLQLAYAGVRFRQGQFADAIDWAERAAENAEAADDRRELAHAYYLQDGAHTRLGQPDEGLSERALLIYEEIGDLIGQANVHNNLGVDAYFAGKWKESLEEYERSGELSRQAGDVVSGARATNNAAEILSDQGRLEEAEEHFEESLRAWRAARYPIGVALATSNLGRVAARAGRFEDAHSLFEEARAGFRRIGAEAFASETNARISECLVLEGRYKEAADLATETLANVEDSSVVAASLERLLGYAAVQARKPGDEAHAHLDRSLELGRSLEAQYEVALTLKAIADVDKGAGDERGEGERILEALGVLSVPSPPLP